MVATVLQRSSWPRAIIKGERGVTAETAILRSRVFDTPPEFRLNQRTAVDLWNGERTLERAAPRGERGFRRPSRRVGTAQGDTHAGFGAYPGPCWPRQHRCEIRDGLSGCR